MAGLCTRFLAASFVALPLCLHTASVFGRADATLDYSKLQTYSAALRYLRVELDYEITERDPDAAYLIFRYRPPARRDTVAGTLEIIEAQGHVRVFVRLPQMPSYHEQVLRDGLLRKLRDEYGEPVQAPTKPKPAPKETKPAENDKPADKPGPKKGTAPDA